MKYMSFLNFWHLGVMKYLFLNLMKVENSGKSTQPFEIIPLLGGCTPKRISKFSDLYSLAFPGWTEFSLSLVQFPS
jgi:hypothetical protein